MEVDTLHTSEMRAPNGKRVTRFHTVGDGLARMTVREYTTVRTGKKTYSCERVEDANNPVAVQEDAGRADGAREEIGVEENVEQALLAAPEEQVAAEREEAAQPQVVRPIVAVPVNVDRLLDQIDAWDVNSEPSQCPVYAAPMTD